MDNKPHQFCLTPKDTANYLGVTENTLAKWRSTGKHSIPFIKLGTGSRASVRYEMIELEKFIERCREDGSGVTP